MYLLKSVHRVQTSKTWSNVRSKSSYRKWMPITTFCFISSHDTVCADCCANITELITTSITRFEAGRSWMFCEISTDSGTIQQVRALDFVLVKTHRVPLHHLPENNVSSLVSFPCLDQCKVSSDGLFHDVVPAIELFHLCTMTAHSKGVRNTKRKVSRSISRFWDRFWWLMSSLWLVLPFTYCIVLSANNGGFTNPNMHWLYDGLDDMATAEMTALSPLSAHWR